MNKMTSLTLGRVLKFYEKLFNTFGRLSSFLSEYEGIDVIGIEFIVAVRLEFFDRLILKSLSSLYCTAVTVFR